MTSKIVVNNIEADAGVSTVFFNSDIGATDGTLNVDGNLTVDGVITYEDVTSVDSVGIITAQAGIRVTGGSVGIGTELPTSPLAVMSSSDPEIRFGYNETQDHRITWDSSKVFLEADPDNANGSSALGFRVDGTEALRIDSDGKVGIGTDNPAGTLEIDAASTTDMIMLDVSGTNFARLGHNTASGTDILDVRSEGHTRFLTNGNNERLRIDSSGRLLKSGQAALTSTTLSYPIQVAAASDANAIAIFGRAADDIGELAFYEADKTTKLGELQYRQDHLNLRCRVGDIRFASGGTSERLRIDGSGRIAQGGKTPTNHGSPNLLIWGSDPTVHLTSIGSTNNSSFTGIKFAVAGGSTGDYSKAGIFVQRQDSYNDLDMIFAFRSSNDATGVSISDEKMRINSDGNLGIGHADPTMRLYVKDTGADISNGNAIINSTQKGIRLEVNNNDDKSLGLWFSTGSHHSGISGQRNNSASTWGTDLRFYTHENATNDLTYTRERIRINPHGLLINRKGQNAANTGGSILGRYKYTQHNQGSGYTHLILAPDGRKLQDYISTNCYCIITVCVTGTGTNNMFCQYYYHANSTPNSSTLTHMYGNSGSSSNRPYMNLQNTHDPAWLMSHNGGYRLDIEVAIYGGANGFTYTEEFGDFAGNP